MNQFTQLNLNGKPEVKTASQTPMPKNQPPRPGKPGDNKNTHKPKTITVVGSAVAIGIMGVALFQSVGCSKAEKTTISAPTPQASNQPMTPSPAPVATTPDTTAKKPVKKAAPKAKIPTATYSNKDFGLSYRYPKYDTLKQGDDAKVAWSGIGPVPMNFSQPGGTTLSAVELPNGLYPGTDFSSAFFNASVAPKLTEAQCNDFASSDSKSDMDSNSASSMATPSKDATPSTSSSDSNVSATSNSDSKEVGDSKPASTSNSTASDKPASSSKAPSSKVKIGTTEYSVMETIAGDDKQADAKYYHVYKNGNCYEFTLGMQTANAGDDETVTPVNRSQVFHKLEWILATVKIASPETQEATSAAPATTADSGNNTGTVAAAAPVAPVKIIDDRQETTVSK